MSKPTDNENGQRKMEVPHDFLEQYLIFDPIDAEDSIHLAKPMSTLPVRSLGEALDRDNPSKFWEDEAGQSDTFPQSELVRHRLSAVCPEPIGSVSAQALLSLKSISLHSPEDLSPPSSPNIPAAESLRGRRRTPKRQSMIYLRDSSISHQRRSSPIGKATCPPKMMHPSCCSENIQDLEQRLALGKFEFGFQDTSVPLSPPPSARISDSSDYNNNMVPNQQQNDGTSWDRQLQQHFTYRAQGSMDSPLITPPADIKNFHHSNFHHAGNHDMVFASPQDHAPSLWIQDPFNSNPFDSSTAYVSEEGPAPLMWNHASTALVQPSPNAYHRHGSHSNKSLAMEQQAELAYNANELALSPSSMPSGLMIQMAPQSPGQKSFTAEATPSSNQPHLCYPPTVTASSQPRRSAHRYTQSQPPSLHQSNEYFANPRNRRDKSRSRAESASPPSPRARSSSFHISKQRRSGSRKRGDQAGTVKTSKPVTNGNANATLDFVNFTPNDRKKILTGVAPSGSSKTKARREKEALEKSRRLSQAAVRAVKAVGGSIEGLMEEGLFEAQNAS